MVLPLLRPILLVVVMLLLLLPTAAVATARIVEDSFWSGYPRFTTATPEDNDNDAATDTATATPEIDMGTTLVALKYKHGVVVGADTQTSSSTYVSNRFAHKLDSLWLDPVNDDTTTTTPQQRPPISSCVICRSGSAADTQFLVRQCTWEFTSSPRWMRLYDVPGFHHHATPTISQVAHFLRYLMRQGSSSSGDGNGDEPTFQASLICAGYDTSSSGGRIFAITQGGTILEEPMVSVSGSGSTYVLGHLDQTLKQLQQSRGDNNNNEDSQTTTSSLVMLDEDDAIDLVVQLIRLSIARDASSGGWIRLIVLNANGQRHLTFPPTSTGTAAAVEQENQSLDESSRGTELPGFANVKQR
jgi:20S proteasome subunit beta 1